VKANGEVEFDHNWNLEEMEDQIREDVDVYGDLLDRYLPCVVGARTMRQNRARLMLSEYVSVSDEVITILLLENNWDRWVAKAKLEALRNNNKGKEENEEEKEERENLIRMAGRARYTSRRNREKKIKVAGWSDEGKLRYNKLWETVKEKREKNRYFDADYVRKKLHTEKPRQVDSAITVNDGISLCGDEEE